MSVACVLVAVVAGVWTATQPGLLDSVVTPEEQRHIAEEAFAFVREYKGSHSGEHGDGLVRSEFHAPMFGERLVRAFEQVKDRFDPQHLYNPGKIMLEMIEVQTGSYLGEDDIVRVSDEFGRDKS